MAGGDEQHAAAPEAAPEPPAVPLLRVVRGDPTPEELAALVAVVAASAAPATAPPRPRPVWSAPARRLREPLRPGPGGWRASGLPR